VTLPLELVASSITLQFWTHSHGEHSVWNHAIWVTIFLVGIIVVNVFGVKGYGNVEAFLSMAKAIAIVGFM